MVLYETGINQVNTLSIDVRKSGRHKYSDKSSDRCKIIRQKSNIQASGRSQEIWWTAIDLTGSLKYQPEDISKELYNRASQKGPG